MLKNVVLPAPLGPMSDTIDPRGMSKSTLLTAVRPPHFFVTPPQPTRGIAGAALPVANVEPEPVAAAGEVSSVVTGPVPRRSSQGLARRAPSHPGPAERR